MARALVIIDVLTGIFELPVPLHEPETFAERVAGLLARARQANALIVHVRQLGDPGTRFAPDAPTRQFHTSAMPLADELVIEKRHPDAFQNTALADTLRARDVRGVAIAGFATDFCVDASVRSGYAHGFEIALASDAHTTTAGRVLSAADAVAHHNFVLERFARVQPAADIAFEMPPASV